MSRKSTAMKFAKEEWDIAVTGRNVHVTEAMKNYAVEKLAKIEKFSHRIIDVAVTMDIQKTEHRVEIIVKVDNIKITTRASTNDMYASIDKAIGKLEEQLRRHKSKSRDHHAKSTKEVDMRVNVIEPARTEEIDSFNEDIENENIEQLVERYRPHRIVGQEMRPLKTLNYDEAVMKMETSGDTFIIFRGEDDQKIKVIYRRTDGNYGIVEPEI
jgi:putative sigma-54 modulation protein